MSLSSATKAALKDKGTIIRFVDDNPKRPGSAAYVRFMKYKASTTVEEALKKGADSGNLISDCKKSYLRVIKAGHQSKAKPASPSRALRPTQHAEAAPAKAALRRMIEDEVKKAVGQRLMELARALQGGAKKPIAARPAGKQAALVKKKPAAKK